MRSTSYEVKDRATGTATGTIRGRFVLHCCGTQERSRGLLSCDMPICNPFTRRNYGLCREATLQVIPDLSPVAVKSLDAISLNCMQPGLVAVGGNNASLKIVLPPVAVYDHCRLSWYDFWQWVCSLIKERSLAEKAGS